MSSSSGKIPLWLDCDPGHDDAFAILLAAHHPRLNLLGVSTVHGNASLAQTTSNALRILTAIGKPDIPVYPGAARPFARDPIHAPDIHGESGLDGTDLLPQARGTARDPDVEPAILAMRNAILAQPLQTAWVVATGAWTNAALLFASFPEVARHVAGVSVMGGAIGGRFSEAIMGKVERGRWVGRVGNTTPWAEFNVYCDPEAARSLLCNPLLQGKLVLIPLDVTHLALASNDIQQSLLKGKGSTANIHPLRQMFYDLLTFFASTYRNVFGFTDGPPLHDPLAVAVILDMLGIEDFGFEDGKEVGQKGTYWIVDVVTSDERGGTAVVDGDTPSQKRESQLGRVVLVSEAMGQEGGVRIPRRIKRLDRFWEAIELSLQKAETAPEGSNLWSR